jgi:hypothetical protein
MTHNSRMLPDTQQQRWMAQWRAAGAALRAQRASELAALPNEQALAGADAVLSIDLAAALPEARRTSSGLVRQQAGIASSHALVDRSF